MCTGVSKFYFLNSFVKMWFSLLNNLEVYVIYMLPSIAPVFCLNNIFFLNIRTVNCCFCVQAIFCDSALSTKYNSYNNGKESLFWKLIYVSVVSMTYYLILPLLLFSLMPSSFWFYKHDQISHFTNTVLRNCKTNI